MTRQEAIDKFNIVFNLGDNKMGGKFWETMTAKEIVKFQMNEKRLCIPFDVFHKAVEDTLGYPVFTPQFIDPKLKEAINNVI